jgi:hypothetical protein
LDAAADLPSIASTKRTKMLLRLLASASNAPRERAGYNILVQQQISRLNFIYHSVNAKIFRPNRRQFCYTCFFGFGIVQKNHILAKGKGLYIALPNMLNISIQIY